jgi:hypothetical protein
MRRTARRTALATGTVACLLFAAGCGDGGLPRELTPGQQADLHALVSQARTAAGAGDPAATQAALERLQARVRSLRDSGAIEADRAAALLKYSALAELKAAHTIAPPPPPPAPAADAPAPAPAAVTPPPAAATATPRAARKAKGHGHGKRAKPGR